MIPMLHKRGINVAKSVSCGRAALTHQAFGVKITLYLADSHVTSILPDSATNHQGPAEPSAPERFQPSAENNDIGQLPDVLVHMRAQRIKQTD